MTGDTSKASRFNAAGPALGYLAQVDYALWAMLERMDIEESFSLSIETPRRHRLACVETDDATQKLQSKHSIDGTRSLSDASSDLSSARWRSQLALTPSPLPLMGNPGRRGEAAQWYRVIYCSDNAVPAR